MRHPFVSVIIPSYNDSDRLGKCLDALESQTYLNSCYEVIVVDNGSRESIEHLVKKYSQSKLAQEKRIGSYAARNKGLTVAKGEIIAFTDSDCIPKSDWIEKGVLNLQKNPDCGLVGGRVDLFFRDSLKPSMVELYELATAFPQKMYIEEQRFSVTANLFTFKSVINTVGPFDDSLKSGGDFEWGNRVYNNGFKLEYANDVCVKHPARYSFKELYSKVFRVMGGHDSLTLRSSRSFTESMYLWFIYAIPPVPSVIKVFQDSRLVSLGQKFKAVTMQVIVKYLRLYERIRLCLGGKPRRQ